MVNRVVSVNNVIVKWLAATSQACVHAALHTGNGAQVLRIELTSFSDIASCNDCIYKEYLPSCSTSLEFEKLC